MTDSKTEIAAFYRTQSTLTDPGRHADAVAAWPDDVRDLMATVQSLLIYDVVATPFYSVTLSPERQSDIHLRYVPDILDRVLALDPAPINESRRPQHRVPARCNNFGLLLLSALRQRGVPARARSGFGTYFNPDHFEDHWIVEYQDVENGAWHIADAQFDAVWTQKLGIDHDIADVPRDRFLTAADVWRGCRAGTIDASRAGISHDSLYGLFFVAGSLVRDMAALNKTELLPWDIWGAQPALGSALDGRQLQYFDDLAALLVDPDTNFTAIQQRYADDDGLRVPGSVVNALLNRREALCAA